MAGGLQGAAEPDAGRERSSAAEPAPLSRAEEQEARLLARIAELEAEVLRLTSVAAHHEQLWRSLQSSLSWRITAPLRRGAERVSGGRR